MTSGTEYQKLFHPNHIETEMLRERERGEVKSFHNGEKRGHVKRVCVAKQHMQWESVFGREKERECERGKK